MIAHGKEVKVFAGNSNRELALGICKALNRNLGNATVERFADGEASVTIHETVRGLDVFVVQSTCKPVNDSLMELLVIIDALKRASAGRITAVIPYYGYARQDRKAKPPRPHLRQAGGQPHRRGRRQPGADHGPARAADPGLF